ncbi:hypothetical protein IWX64_002698 [Arthrobacter sp. CAN_A212]|uniref:hypothetical protein n=1 Tax=Arthrobacter sp. CAN_A212 TaxID=2787719 RepID=UPI0018CBB6A6
MATAEEYGFLNTVEGLDEESVEALPSVLRQFPTQHHPTLIATTPSQSLVDLLLRDGYAPASTRPIAYLRPRTSTRSDGIVADEWQIIEVSTQKDAKLFLALLDDGYAVSREVGASKTLLASSFGRFMRERWARITLSTSLHHVSSGTVRFFH